MDYYKVEYEDKEVEDLTESEFFEAIDLFKAKFE